MTDPLSTLWAAMEAIEPVLLPEAWRRVPSDARGALTASGLVKPGAAVSRVRCPNCIEPHNERIVKRPSRNGDARFFIRCPRTGRVPVGEADWLTWRVDVSAVAVAVAASLGLDGEIRPVSGDRLYHCGRLARHGVRMDVYLARGLRRRDGAAVTAAIPKWVVAPTVLVPSEQPQGTAWSEPEPFSMSLSLAARLQEGRLVVERAPVEAAALRASRGDHAAANVFRRRTDFWEVAFDGEPVEHLKHSIGMSYVARIIAEPQRVIPAVTLLAAEAGIDARVPRCNLGTTIDERARREMQTRYDELQERRAAAERIADQGALQAVERESDQLIVELKSRLGLRGDPREESDADRVRKAVSAAVTRAIDTLVAKAPPLGHHLRAAISCGRSFSYRPERPIEWSL